MNTANTDSTINDIESNGGMYTKDYLFYFTRPDTYAFEFNILEMPQNIIVNRELCDMSLTILYAYSVDGISFSRYYEDQEYDDFMQTVRDSYSKGFDVCVRLRLETELAKEDSFYESNTDSIYYVRINSILVNTTPIEINKQYVINSNGVTLQNQTQLFNPYANMQSAYELQLASAIAINNMFGHWAYYFKTDPDESTKNVTLKAYQLHNVTSMKKIKISIPDNKFPTNRNIYSEWGIQLADEFNVHILNNTFETAFGKGEIPHTHDYIYFPINGIMYEVNAFYNKRNFMQTTIYNDVILVRYEDNKAVIKGEFEDETLQYTELTLDGGLTVEEELESQTADPNYLNISLLEYFRLQMHKNTQIVNHNLYYNRIKLFDNMYLLSNVPIGETGVSFDCKKTMITNNSLLMFFGLEKITPSREIAYVTTTDGNKIISIQIQKGFLNVSIGGKSIVSTSTITADTRYGLCINLSNIYEYVSLTVAEYDESKQCFKQPLNTDFKQIPIAPISLCLDKLFILGGRTLISNITFDSVTYDCDSIINALTRVTPLPENNILFDKCAVPVSDDKMNIT